MQLVGLTKVSVSFHQWICSVNQYYMMFLAKYVIRLFTSPRWVSGNRNLQSSSPPILNTWCSITINTELYISSRNVISLSGNLSYGWYLLSSYKSSFYFCHSANGYVFDKFWELLQKGHLEKQVCMILKFCPADCHLLTNLRPNRLHCKCQQFDHQEFFERKMKSVL